MDKKDLKLVDYTDSSSSSDDKEKIKFPYPKIAVVNPMQIVTPEIITDVPEHDETTQFEHDETTEFDPDVSLTRQPIPPSSDNQPEQVRRESEIPEPEPEIIILSSDSETLSIRTDTSLGL